MIAFIEGQMTLPMGKVTRDRLINHRLSPHQCAPNLFRVLGSVDALNEQMGLGLTWHDVVHMYECHKLANAGYYLKSRSNIVRLVSCLRKSNKGMKDDYLIAFREWHDGLINHRQGTFPKGLEAAKNNQRQTEGNFGGELGGQALGQCMPSNMESQAGVGWHSIALEFFH